MEKTVTTFAYLSSILYGASAFILGLLSGGTLFVEFKTCKLLYNDLYLVRPGGGFVQKTNPIGMQHLAPLPFVGHFHTHGAKVFCSLIESTVYCTVYKQSIRPAESELKFQSFRAEE
jgi:hypothetical protein